MSSDDHEIRSAFEIAMEKAEKLGNLSAEEKRQLHEEELLAAGEALRERYLNGLPLRDIDVELRRRTDEDRRIVSHHLLRHLLDTIDVTNAAVDDRILAGIEHLSADAEVVQGIRGLLQEYEKALETARQESLHTLEEAMRKELELRGISGSAVQPAIETSPQWLQVRHGLDAHYQERLEEIKRRFRTL
jgi:hypothetical protein